MPGGKSGGRQPASPKPGDVPVSEEVYEMLCRKAVQDIIERGFDDFNPDPKAYNSINDPRDYKDGTLTDEQAAELRQINAFERMVLRRREEEIAEGEAEANRKKEQKQPPAPPESRSEKWDRLELTFRELWPTCTDLSHAVWGYNDSGVYEIDIGCCYVAEGMRRLYEDEQNAELEAAGLLADGDDQGSAAGKGKGEGKDDPKPRRPAPRTPSASEVTEMSKRLAFDPPRIGTEEHEKIECLYINCRSGLIRVEDLLEHDDLSRIKPIEHSPVYPLVVQHPFVFDPGAECPTVDAWVKDRMEDDVAELLFEVLGHCFYGGESPKMAVHLYGESSTGKTTLQELISALVGKANISRVQPQDLENTFTAAELFGKRANIVGEVESLTGPAARIFKQLTGGDPIQVERKNQNPFNMKCNAVWLMAGNVYPKTSDRSGAFFKRMRIVDINRPITDPKSRDEVLRTLTTEKEMSGLANHAMRGLKRALLQDGFSNPKSAQAHADRYREQQDHLYRFVKEVIEFTGDDRKVSRGVVTTEYNRWCKQENIVRQAKMADLYDVLTRTEGVTEYRSGSDRGFKGLIVEGNRRNSGSSGADHRVANRPAGGYDDPLSDDYKEPF